MSEDKSREGKEKDAGSFYLIGSWRWVNLKTFVVTPKVQKVVVAPQYLGKCEVGLRRRVTTFSRGEMNVNDARS